MFGGAVPLGIATGLAAWLVAGAGTARLESFDAMDVKVKASRAPGISVQSAGPGARELMASPIFAMTTGAGALREPSLRVDGISISSRRTAALVSVDGKPAEWMRVGDTRDGVSLQALTSAGATFETPLGSKQLALGEQSAASSPVVAEAASVSTTPASQSIIDEIPPGFRSPPPPASAPSVSS